MVDMKDCHYVDLAVLVEWDMVRRITMERELMLHQEPWYFIFAIIDGPGW